MNKPRVIAFYLPQFHPIPENDKWWGKGFTEWTNVARAKPLFRGHYQPRIPADLGFYDLRIPEVRKQQAELAKEAGIEGFCYYHYWFGSKNKPKELMQMPFNEVVRTGEPDFPFCLCWANHSFEKKEWDATTSFWDRTILVEQKYYGIEDYTEHFYSLLDAFKDKRYIKVNGKNLFVIYRANNIPNVNEFIECWNRLAEENGIPQFYFIQYCYTYEKNNNSLFDAKICDMLSGITNDSIKNYGQKISTKIKKGLAVFFNINTTKIDYDKACQMLIPPVHETEKFIPEIISGFDHSPRTGLRRLILHNYTPQKFEKHVENIFNYLKTSNNIFDNLVFLKSWNEWGEGNYMEPDLKYGHQFIDLLKKKIDNY
jgi:hypothetical protein